MSKKKRLMPVTEEEWERVHPFNKEIFELFLDQSHLSPQSLKQYSSGAKQFFRWIEQNRDNKPLHEIKSRDAVSYQRFLTVEIGMSMNAAKFKRSVVSSLCSLIEVHYSEEYPRFRNIFSRAIPAPVGQPVHEKQPVTKEELKYLIDTLKDQDELQMVAYIMLSYKSGARRSEISQMVKQLVDFPRVKDKEGNEKSYYVTQNIRTKGRGIEGNVRKLQFDEEARDAVLEWLEQRGEDNEDALFVRKYKDGRVEAIQGATFNDWCTEKFTPILEKRIYPHIWRVSRASHLVIDEGKDIKAVQALLGHSSSETSELYVVRDESLDLDSAFE